MKQARLYVDFSEMLEEDLIGLSKSDSIKDSQGSTIKLSEGLKVKVYSDDLSSCGEKDNLIADGIVELNRYMRGLNDAKWCCRIDKKGIYNESQNIK